jgi:hypothetical protein
MIRARRVSMTAVVIVCLLSSHWSETLFAAEAGINNGSVDAASASSPADSEKAPARIGFDALSARNLLGTATPQPKLNFEDAPARLDLFAGQIYQGPPRPYRHRRDGSIAAIMVGAAAAITGGAVLAYANRPECSTNALAGGCGYGTKVVGTAVLSGGIVGLFVGALTWR